MARFFTPRGISCVRHDTVLTVVDLALDGDVDRGRFVLAVVLGELLSRERRVLWRVELLLVPSGSRNGCVCRFDCEVCGFGPECVHVTSGGVGSREGDLEVPEEEGREDDELTRGKDVVLSDERVESCSGSREERVGRREESVNERRVAQPATPGGGGGPTRSVPAR